MNLGFSLIETNMGMEIASIVLIVVIAGSIIYFARSFSIGTIMLLIMSGLGFMLCYKMGWNYLPFAIIMFLSIVFLTFSVYASTKLSSGGNIQ